MRQGKNNIFANIDWVLILLYFILVIFGWVNIYAASSTGTSLDIFDFSTKYGKQMVWILLSIPLIIVLLFMDSKFYEQFSGVLYIVCSILLAGVLVPFLGKEVNGAHSWYSLGGFTMQPSEFVKAFTALGLAKLMSDRKYNLKLIKNHIKAFVVIFLPAFLIALQPDMGSVLVYFAFFFVLAREGLTLGYIIIGVSSAVLYLLTIYFGIGWIIFWCFLFMTFFFLYNIIKTEYFFKYNWIKMLLFYIVVGGYIVISPYIHNNILEKHQSNRIEILLRMKTDNSGVGYNSHQAVLTVGSGRVFGKGFLQGDRTQGDFVPEKHTDYIFSVVAEEWGFVGSSLLIIVFMTLIYRVIYLSEQTENKFGRIYGYGVASIFFFHVMINIGMVIGLFPTVGIPLPFFSYGGSGLWGFTILLFIFIRLDAHRENEY